jgi:opacity protein-like surface antigen
LFNRIRWSAVALVASSLAANAQTFPSFDFLSNPVPGAGFGVWTGLYAGAGISISKTTLGFPNGSGTFNLSDTTAPGVSTFRQTYPMGKDLWADGTFIDFGARYQINRIVIGADFDMEFGKKKAIAPNQDQRDGIAGVFTTGNFPSLGMSSFGGAQSLGHLRAILGFSISPKVLLFGSYGISKARFFDTGVSVSGAVASSPSAPLVGAATVSSVPGTKYGRSIGFGMDVKATDNVIARIEYINDHYSMTAPGGAGFGGTIGEITVNNFITTGGRATYDINTVRASLNYRIGPSDTSPEIAKLTSQDSYGKWGGFYVGVGETATHNKTTTNGIDNLTITNTLLGTTPFSYARNPTREGDRNYEHLFAGYMHQFWRIVLGVEYSHNFNSEFDYRLYPLDGTLTGTNFISAPGSGECAIYVSGAFTCVGGRFYGAFKATDHIRGIVGVEVLPSLLVFGSAGVVRGVGHFQAVSASGFVASSPSAPLVGKATVSNPQTKVVWGNSIGGGVQYRMADHFSVRVEYLRDSADMPITGGGAGFGGTIGNQTTNFFISSGTKEKFVNESWRVALIYQL